MYCVQDYIVRASKTTSGKSKSQPSMGKNQVDLYADAHTPADLAGVAQELLSPDVTVILLEGPLGAGKTSFVQAACRVLGSTDEVNSPTFALIQEYRDGGDQPVYHIDLYRLASVEEALQIGIGEYLNSGHLCFVEWPEILGDLVQGDGVLRLRIEVLGDATRRFHILR